MATIDCTLGSFMLPGLPTYANAFGTKKNAGTGLSTAECVTDTMMPFARQRPFAVTETSETTAVEANSVFRITASGVTLTIADAAFEGCTALVVNASGGGVTIKGGASGLNGGSSGVTLAAGFALLLVYCGGWITACATGAGGANKAYSTSEVAGGLSVGGALSVSGAVTAGSAVTASGDITSSSAVQGATVAASGNATVGGDLAVTGTISASNLGQPSRAYTLNPIPGTYSSSAGAYHYFLLGQVPTPSQFPSTVDTRYSWSCAGRLVLSRPSASGHRGFVFAEFAAGYGYSHLTTFTHLRAYTKGVNSNSANMASCDMVTCYYSSSYWIAVRCRLPYEGTLYSGDDGSIAHIDYCYNMPSMAFNVVTSVSNDSTTYASNWSIG